MVSWEQGSWLLQREALTHQPTIALRVHQKREGVGAADTELSNSEKTFDDIL